MGRLKRNDINLWCPNYQPKKTAYAFKQNNVFNNTYTTSWHRSTTGCYFSLQSNAYEVAARRLHAADNQWLALG